MLPTITIFGHEIAMYGVMCLSGILAAIVVCILRAKKCNLSKEDILYMGILSAIGIVVGGKILYLLIDIPVIIKYSSYIFGSLDQFFAYMSGGFVFYGGLFGAIYVIYLYCHKFSVSFQNSMICMVPSFPIAHALGRVGCFMAGCCHGRNGIPVQLYEGIGNMLIFLILLLVEKIWNKKQIPYVYLTLYAIMRFILEFFRADSERGFIFTFSTSQWISILVVAFVVFQEIRLPKK
ncbi:MAG TPA: prolipoprotein diacylglyceryl transferase family protein [Lachnospiraceae bacterium]|nr:prolipoprotein diacylglyceryl transferase family protein [Lachnospiraceae bacterium]